MQRIFTSILVFLVLGITACGNSERGRQAALESGSDTQSAPEVSIDDQETTKQEPLEVSVMENGLEIKVMKEGEGVAVENGQRAVMHYTGWFYDENLPDQRGAKFDSSRDRGNPLPFVLGEGNVIQGWDLGVLGMKVGEQRILNIPSELAYGERGHPAGIPPNSKLTFEVELMGIE